jgi:hypothetical protein
VHEERLVRAEAVQRLAALEAADGSGSRDGADPAVRDAGHAGRFEPADPRGRRVCRVCSIGRGRAFACPSWARPPAIRPRRLRVAPCCGPESPALAVLAAGVACAAVRGARAPLAKALPAAEPLARKRSFEEPFQSDLDALNGFAARLHGQTPDAGDDVAAQVALLQDLIDRTRSA